jgi:hypothetical protein
LALTSAKLEYFPFKENTSTHCHPGRVDRYTS